MKEYITKKMVEDGLMSKVIIPELEDDVTLLITIGDNFFVITCFEFNYKSVNEIPFEVLVNEIKDALDDFYGHPDMFEDEYLYYYYYLCENI